MTEATQNKPNSRVWAKFRRHKPAMVSLLIISVYVLVGVAVLFGLVTIKDTTAEFAPPHLPGLGFQQEPEKRLEDAKWYLEKLRAPLGAQDPQTALAEFPISGLKATNYVVDGDNADVVTNLQARFEEGESLQQQLAQVPDLNGVIAANDQNAQTTEEKLSKLESVVASMVENAEDVGTIERSLQVCLGTDRLGRSNFLRAVYSIRVAILVGLVTGLVSVVIGTFLGLLAGYFGGWVDLLITWLYSTFASIPNIVLLILLVYVFREGTVDDMINGMTDGWLEKLLGGSRLDGTLVPVYVAFCATFWIGPCRIIRGEVLKLREQEYIQAAQVLGYGTGRILFRHLLPNVSHLMLINFSLLFIGAIKSEVILSYLGLGVQEGASWGLMISFAKDEVVNANFWQIGVATLFMFILVLAFNVLSDAMQDILDPKHV